MKGEVTGIVGSIFDITERKKAEAKTRKSTRSHRIASAMMHKIRAGLIIVDSEFKGHRF